LRSDWFRKELAAFLACIDRLVRKALAGELEDKTESFVYLAPKGAQQRHSKKPGHTTGRILLLARERGFLMPEIRTAVRTGDTLMHHTPRHAEAPATYSGYHPNLFTFCSRLRKVERFFEPLRLLSWMKSTPSPTTNAVRTFLFRSNASMPSPEIAHAHRSLRHTEANRTDRTFSGRKRAAGSGNRPDFARRHLDLVVEVPPASLAL